MARTQHLQPDAPRARTARKAPPSEWSQHRGKGSRNGDWVTDARFGHAAVEHAHAASTPSSGAGKVNAEEDTPIPTPVGIIQYKVLKEYPDGRTEISNRPCPGLEHLYHELNDPAPSTQNQTSGRTDEVETGRKTAVSSPSTTSSPVLSSRKRAVSESFRRRQVKRARNIPRVPVANAAAHNNDSDSDVDDFVDDAQGEREAAVEMSKTFQMGNMKSLKEFFIHRIEELTMKPVRGMVTAWIKHLEPRRTGSYHRKKPIDVPNRPSAPWWPQDVEYVEPSHLAKDGLLKLAIECIFQHRDTPVDEAKRRYPGGWIAKLRTIAEFCVNDTPEDQFSSSKNTSFSRMMKTRAVKSILPSLFEVAQSYEDYVFQHGLWKQSENNAPPLGATITWHFIDRPAKLITLRRWTRTVRPKRILSPSPEVESAHETSGDETEIDEDMARLADRMARRLHRTVTGDDQDATRRDTAGKVSSPIARAVSPLTKVSSPVMAATPPDRQRNRDESTPSASRNSSVSHHLIDDTKAGSFIAGEPGLHPGFNQLPHYPTLQHVPSQPVQQANGFDVSGSPMYPPFGQPAYMTPGPFQFFDPHQDSYALTGPGMTPNALGYHQVGGNMFQPMMRQMSDMSFYSASPSFDGLPCDMGPGAPLPMSAPHMPVHEGQPSSFAPFAMPNAGPAVTN